MSVIQEAYASPMEGNVPTDEASNAGIVAGRLAVVRAIVTGCGDIGEAIGRRFLEEGADLTVFDFNETAGRKLEEELRDLYGEDRVFFHQVDITQDEEVRRAVDEANERGTVTTLVNNAGVVGENARLVNLNPDILRRTIATNLIGPIICAQAVVRHMFQARKEGNAADFCIINASSVIGEDGNICQTDYGGAKGGLITVTKGWARELFNKKIRSNVILPGYVEGTRMVKTVPVEWLIENVINKTPGGRLVTTNQLAGVYARVAGDPRINGQVIRVANGYRP